jgi:hypothetical protein
MSLFMGRRHERGLSDREVEYCVIAWSILCGEDQKTLIIDEAGSDRSGTRFVEQSNLIYLGADAYPGQGFSANSRMSVLACLAHELSHAERFARGYRRPLEMPDMLIDEAEASLDASFHPALNPKNREDLREDARDRLTDWLAVRSKPGEIP